ncbi:D-alanyl-lipoteichoic acid acyltransferase DltB (MBOAT superfamily) [Lacrimispora xylanisolvens]|uniref:D-alanyl-lipoteichoic acid acyltransferase DltB (MBOAT superfamily) n=1 Tax=Lacrimispora xylanisolvens TaxID=384636 RepID=A0A2S6HZG3_9FIRM|nr:MBOAT family O-acyltransferase [Hungatella xylanolytica]PPK83547.1 D-alanyl-lipoteichoic acid acyltransferase DltB (MBOAT superfamily) [Hungatella xylanolytica]
MQFNSYVFILLFLPLQVISYFFSNRINDKLGKAVIVIGSIIFYAYSDISLIKVMLLSGIINYLFSICINRFNWKRVFLCIPIIINLTLLLFFKYTNFAISNINILFAREIPLKSIIQPLGISFFTFQQISYLVSVYTGIVNTSILDYMAYILYFPKILMGPLVEPADFYQQINNTELKKIDWNNIAVGIKLFSYGLFKKLLLADTFAKGVSWGYSNISTATSMDWIFITLFYTFEIYFDFSGYSDMAVGSSLMLNITLPINFDSPYKSLSIRDFWKRWHISLTSFFTKYIYFPLGGSRRGKLFIVVNTMIVFIVSGIWHGANWTFILWGILHGAFSIFDRVTEDKQKKIFEPARRIMTFALINFLWLLFRSDSIQQWKEIVRTVCLFQNTAITGGLLDAFNLPEQAFILKIIPIMNKLSGVRGLWMLLFTFSAFAICLIPENNYRNKDNISWISMIYASVAFVWAFTCLGAESVFVYFNF